MSWTRFSMIAVEGDRVDIKARLDKANKIPALDINDIVLQFDPGQSDFAIEYLTKLAAEATALVQMITEAQS